MPASCRCRWSIRPIQALSHVHTWFHISSNFLLLAHSMRTFWHRQPFSLVPNPSCIEVQSGCRLLHVRALCIWSLPLIQFSWDPAQSLSVGHQSCCRLASPLLPFTWLHLPCTRFASTFAALFLSRLSIFSLPSFRHRSLLRLQGTGSSPSTWCGPRFFQPFAGVGSLSRAPSLFERYAHQVLCWARAL